MYNMVPIKETRKLHFDENVYNFLNPDYVYIPIEEGYNLAVTTNALIFKEQVLLKKGDLAVYSPISGKVLGATTSMKLNNCETKCIVIENDFREKVNKKKGTIKYINEYSKQEFIDLVKKYNGYNQEIDTFAKTMVINGIDSDPFERTVSLIINNHSAQILEAIDAIQTILEIDTTILAINNNDSSNVINLTNNIGTYPNIQLKLLPDIYPIGFRDVLIKNILTKRQIESRYLYFTIQDIYTIYNVLKRKKPITERLVTLSGNAIDCSRVINVKIGTPLDDIIKNCCEITDDKYFVISNGLLSGITLDTLNNIVTSDTKSIFVNTCDRETEKKCINCGLCNSKCPVGLNPKYIKEHKKADRSKCLNCGLCTYICPSKINFKTYLGGRE